MDAELAPVGIMGGKGVSRKNSQSVLRCETDFPARPPARPGRASHVGTGRSGARLGEHARRARSGRGGEEWRAPPAPPPRLVLTKLKLYLNMGAGISRVTHLYCTPEYFGAFEAAPVVTLFQVACPGPSTRARGAAGTARQEDRP